MPKKSLENQKIERRHSPRTELQTKVKILKDGLEAIEESRTHSLTGLFLKTNTPDNYKLDEKVEVSFKDESGVDRFYSGTIVRTTRKGVAIHYI